MSGVLDGVRVLDYGRSIETPFRMSAAPGSVRRRAPPLGEHTDEVLCEIGYDAAGIAELRANAVV